MQKLNVLTGKTTAWTRSVITAAIFLLLSMNAIAQAPAPTDPYVANVTSFGATANDGTDDTQAIQNAIDWLVANHPGGTVLVPNGSYWIDALTSVHIKSNMTLKMESGAILKAIPNSSGAYEILAFGTGSGASNVNIIGGTIQGERHQHLTPGDDAFTTPPSPECPSPDNCWGQWGMGLNITGSNIYVYNVTTRECWGDGVYVGNMQCTNVTLDRVIADNNRRQGLSIIWCDGVIVKNSIFTNTGGHNPGCGIDIEPNAGNTATNIQIVNNLFLNQPNSGGILLYGLAAGAAINNVIIDGNALWGNYDGILIGGSSNITVTNNTIIGSYRGFDLSSGGMNNSTITGNNILAEICINGTPDPSNTINNNICNDGVPRISTRATSLAFGSVPVNTTSAEKIYMLSGVNLGTNNITVTAPIGYTVSTTTGTGFASSVSVTPSSGIVSQFIYVRFTPTAVQSYNNPITNASTGATTQNVVLTGTGTIPTALGTIDGTKVNTNQLIVYPNSSNGVFTVQSTREVVAFRG